MKNVSRWRRILGIQSLSLTYGRQKLNLWVAVSPPEAPSGVKKEAALFQRFNDRSVVVIWFISLCVHCREGEGHVSSDEEDLADDADATDARKRARQADEDYEEGLSDEEMDLVKNIAKEFDDDQILDDGEQSGLTTRTPSPTLGTKYA